jgi:hypothetical protein
MAGTGRKPFETTELTQFGVDSRRLRPPDCLGEPQKRAFIDLVGTCPIAQFRRSDLPLLARWAELVVLAETAAHHLTGDGAVAEGKRSPWFDVHQGASRELRALSLRLQLGPRARSPKAPKVQPAPVSYYDRMRLEGGLDADAN